MATSNESNEIRITRVYDAPVSAVWDAWTVPEQVAAWWGPRGFTLTSHSRDVRTGGSWHFTMHGPDGVDYPNVIQYLVVEPRQKLVYDHGSADGAPPLFRVTVTFREVQGWTTLEITSTWPSAEAAREAVKFIKYAGGNTTWDRLAEHLRERSTGAQIFVIHRSFEAPIDRVFAMWTSPDHLAQWLPPPGMTMRFLRADIGPGKSAFFAMEGAQGILHARFDYRTVEAPSRIVYTQQFVDENEKLAPAPGVDAWPPALRTTVAFAPEGPHRTRVTVTTEPDGEATAAELNGFVGERSGMTLGWTASFDALDERLGSGAA